MLLSPFISNFKISIPTNAIPKTIVIGIKLGDVLLFKAMPIKVHAYAFLFLETFHNARAKNAKVILIRTTICVVVEAVYSP